MNEDDLIDKILEGLGDDYKEIIRAVQARDTMIMFDELHEKLLNFEASLQGAKSEPSHFPASANPANRNTTSWRPSFNYGNTSNNWRPSTHSGNNKTDWRPSPNTNNRSPAFPNAGQNSSQMSLFSLGAKSIQYNSSCTSEQHSNTMATSSSFCTNTTPTTPQWLLDNGASHHVTADLSNLSLHTPYTGSDDIMIGDGSSLPITHTGSTSFTTHNTSFKFDNVLCVPSMRKNLISISQFCTSNNVSVEFLPSSFHVKELRTGEILLKGHTKDGVYEWQISFSSTAPLVVFSSVKTSSFEWHHRLGHLAFLILKHIVSHYQLDLSSSLISDFLCNACHCNKSHKLPFSTSTVVSSQPLEIIFSDVWTSPVISHNSLVETHFQKKIHTLYSDNGGEYLALRTFLTTHGITHLTTPPHTPEHNGYSERRHRHIVETGLTLLSHASLPLTFWTHAFATTVYLINRMPTPTLNLSSPYENIFGSPPNYSKLRIFGCLCYPWLRPYSSHKLDAYMCYHPPTSRMYVSRHVKFVESVFPSLTLSMPSACPQPDTISTWIPPIITVPTNQASTGTFNTPSAVQPQGQLSCDASFPAINTTPHISHESTIHPTISLPSPEIQPTTSMLSPNTQPNTSISGRVGAGDPGNPRNCHSYTQLSHPCDIEPTTVTQALKDPKWRWAMSEEYDALVRNGTWELWIFRTKGHFDGSVDRHKARLVAKGFHQRPGIDYHDTFSPVVKPATIRLVLSLAVSRGWSLRQLDVNNAFLQGHLSEDVYMSQPPGFVDLDNPTHVCKLRKAIYGLKQAPRAWYHELRKFLIASGFHNSHADTSLFVLNTGGNLLYLLVYVDDIILTGNDDTMVHKFMQLLAHQFSLKDLGHLSYFLGVEVIPNDHGILLSQRSYIVDLLTCTKMMDAKPVHTPLPTSPPITLHSGSSLKDPIEYRTIVGALQYLSITRLDIAFLMAFSFTMTPSSLHAFSDSDWAGNKDDLTSTSAYVVYISRNPISWSSKKQRTVARFSTEAEYRSATATTAELNWVSSLLTKLGVILPQSPVIYCDNIGQPTCAQTRFHSVMKHVAIDFHFIREQVQNGTLRVSHVSSDDQLVDALTKPLPKSRFLSLKSKIGLVTRPQS
ncbi:hypothetical protein AAG906_000080 [Vitis piasezkii]